MKKILFLVSIVLLAKNSFGQISWDLSFEDSTYLNRIRIDTSSNPNNLWQIGHPNKTAFTSAYSTPNVIVTDTLNPYPNNDTSSFTIIHIGSYGWLSNYNGIYIDGWYYVNSDTLTDYGYIEFSPDFGISWFNVDSTMNHGCCFADFEELPTFSGNSFGWKHFHYCLCTSIPVQIGDTVLYRFTFISDSVQTNKDGLMFDDLQFADFVEAIPEIQNDKLISIFPNPTSNEISVHESKKSDTHSIQVYDYTGLLVYENLNFTGQTIETSFLNNGIYILKYSDRNNYSLNKFEVLH